MSKFEDEPNFITYYSGEDGLHPQINTAFDWFKNLLSDQIEAACHEHVILAGGALRSYFTQTPVKDYDLYCTKAVLDLLSSNRASVLKGYDWALISDTPRSYLFRRINYDPVTQRLTPVDINVIKTPYDSLDFVISQFDFTVCMCAISKNAITYHPDYFTDLATRSLRVNDPEDLLSTLWRMQKYIKLGFEISKDELWKIAEGIAETDLPILVKDNEAKTKHSLKENVKTLSEVFRSS